MTDNKVQYVTLEMSSLDEYSQRELTAYRNLGTLREFRRLQHREMHRRERRECLHRILEDLIGVTIVVSMVTAFIFVILTSL